MKKPKLPKKFKVGCIVWRLSFEDLEEQGVHGDTDKEKKVVRIHTKDARDVQRETLFHELMHVAMEDCSVLKHSYSDKYDQEEDLIRYISPRLVLILQENPELSDFITKGD